MENPFVHLILTSALGYCYCSYCVDTAEDGRRGEPAHSRPGAGSVTHHCAGQCVSINAEVDDIEPSVRHPARSMQLPEPTEAPSTGHPSERAPAHRPGSHNTSFMCAHSSNCSISTTRISSEWSGPDTAKLDRRRLDLRLTLS